MHAGELLGVWEAGLAADETARALLLHALARPAEPLERLLATPIGVRDTDLLVLRRRLFGERVPLRVTCAGCGEEMAFTVGVGEVLAISPASASHGPAETGAPNGLAETGPAYGPANLETAADSQATTRTDAGPRDAGWTEVSPAYGTADVNPEGVTPTEEATPTGTGPVAAGLADAGQSGGRADGAAAGGPSAGRAGGQAAEQVLRYGEWTVRFRLPTVGDLLAAVDAGPGGARRMLLERCLLAVTRAGRAVAAGELPPHVQERIAEACAEADPCADVKLDVPCPECGRRTKALFDIAATLWAELDAWARGTLFDVHLLASAYGWTEPEVLALSPLRRRRYLELVGHA